MFTRYRVSVTATALIADVVGGTIELLILYALFLRKFFFKSASLRYLTDEIKKA